jgi:hypothetical protein
MMAGLADQRRVAMVWTGLPSIDEMPPLSESDQVVVDEIRQVLIKHGALNRFGINLLHSHFELRGDEVLVEHVDRTARTLTTRPLPVGELRRRSLVPTAFRLDETDEVPLAVQYCYRPPNSDLHAC